jgi:hypothetical protein
MFPPSENGFASSTNGFLPRGQRLYSDILPAGGGEESAKLAPTSGGDARRRRFQT